MTAPVRDGQITMKKLAIVYPWFADYRRPIIEALAQELASEFEITLISDSQALEPAMKLIDPESLTVGSEPPIHWEFVRNRKIWQFVWQRGLVTKMLRQKYDTVIFLGEFRTLSTWIGVLIARCKSRRVYFWSHGMYGNEGWLKLRIRLLFSGMAHGIFLYGNYAKKLFVQHGFDPNTMWVVYNSLDHRQQLAVRQSAPLNGPAALSTQYFPAHPEAPWLVFIGRLTKRKQVKLLLDSVHDLFRHGTIVNAMLIGDGPERADLEKYAGELGIRKQICFYGPCHEEQPLADLIGAAHVCVSPGDIGLLAMHCMVYGTPVVTHDDPTTHGPEFEAIVENQTGSFFEKGNIQSLSREINKWILLDDEHRSRVRQNCFYVVDTFFNPEFQSQVFGAVLRGTPPPDAEVCLPAVPPLSQNR